MEYNGTDAPFGPKFGMTGETAESVERMTIPDEEKTRIFFFIISSLLLPR
jgi:hypothetical protein